MNFARSSGLLLHITSLPSRFGIGDMGPGARQFVRALAKAEQCWWQVLPVGPVGLGNSPYAGTSCFAGEPLLVSPQDLVSDGFLSAADLERHHVAGSAAVDYARVVVSKSALFTKAYKRFAAQRASSGFARFCQKEAYWLDHYAAFVALGEHFGKPWTRWPELLCKDVARAVTYAQERLSHHWAHARFGQFVFQLQWQRLRAFCRERGIQIIGDLPIYVSHDSADVWAAQELFQLDDQGDPLAVGGVPPDFFSDTGQRWGNPLYRWDTMQHRGFAWWRSRFRRALDLFDVVRLDHFRGFAGYWEIPVSEPTAVNGRWVVGPGPALFNRLTDAFGPLPVIAEDLGVITEDVLALKDQFGFAGMAVLQFAFDSDEANPYLPHNYGPNLVAFTGTHDNDTWCGWVARAPADVRAFAQRYLGLTATEGHWQSAHVLMASDAAVVILPVQDVLGLGGEARMNTPGTAFGNWAWRLRHNDMAAMVGEVTSHLRSLTRTHRRGS